MGAWAMGRIRTPQHLFRCPYPRGGQRPRSPRERVTCALSPTTEHYTARARTPTVSSATDPLQRDTPQSQFLCPLGGRPPRSLWGRTTPAPLWTTDRYTAGVSMAKGSSGMGQKPIAIPQLSFLSHQGGQRQRSPPLYGDLVQFWMMIQLTAGG